MQSLVCVIRSSELCAALFLVWAGIVRGCCIISSLKFNWLWTITSVAVEAADGAFEREAVDSAIVNDEVEDTDVVYSAFDIVNFLLLL